jgi:hypothetical protein
MRRRDFIAGLGSTAVAMTAAGPVALRAQQPDRVRWVGVLINTAEVIRSDKRAWQHSAKVSRTSVGGKGATFVSSIAGQAATSGASTHMRPSR